ncbi:MAG: hypothetical protein NUV86_01900 [Candidatus Scalindua sp.]|nr:hypothetical protein [Candidatus Scalindua sp.]MCR4344241.1 hypothetical protein [Candidatus Scalindua sp.]
MWENGELLKHLFGTPSILMNQKKRKEKLKKHITPKKKMSEMILEYASDYISITNRRVVSKK